MNNLHDTASSNLYLYILPVLYCVVPTSWNPRLVEQHVVFMSPSQFHRSLSWRCYKKPSQCLVESVTQPFNLGSTPQSIYLPHPACLTSNNVVHGQIMFWKIGKNDLENLTKYLIIWGQVLSWRTPRAWFWQIQTVTDPMLFLHPNHPTFDQRPAWLVKHNSKCVVLGYAGCSYPKAAASLHSSTSASRSPTWSGWASHIKHPQQGPHLRKCGSSMKIQERTFCPAVDIKHSAQ